jgi:hypothetical protein
MDLYRRNYRFADVLWNDISPTEHFVQIYENDLAFLDSMASFVANGLNAGDVVIVIATLAHRVGLENRLSFMDVDIRNPRQTDQYIPLDARQTLSKFMIEGWPDEKRFKEQMDILMKRASKEQRKVRAFGEMVAVLWEDGHKEATVQLEQLWNDIAKQYEFCLYCAYPKVGFTQESHNSYQQICSMHSRVITK